MRAPTTPLTTGPEWTPTRSRTGAPSVPGIRTAAAAASMSAAKARVRWAWRGSTWLWRTER
jgi:hypothetical protein